MVVATRPDTAPSADTEPPVAAPEPALHGSGRTATLLSLGGPDTDPVLSRVSEMLDAATDQVEQFWGTDWPTEIVIVAAGTDQQFAAAAPGSPADMAAVAVADAVDLPGGSASGQRIVLGPGANDMSDSALRMVLTHELFHYAARADTAADAPRWLTEGVADYVARGHEPVPPHVIPTALPDDAEFTGVGVELAAAYDRAWLFARFLADQYGPPALRDLYTRVAGPDRIAPAAALTEVTGSAPERLIERWQRWLAG